MYFQEIKSQDGMCRIIKDLAEIDNDLESLGVHIPHQKNQNNMKYVILTIYMWTGALYFFDFAAYWIQFNSIARIFLVFLYEIPLMVNLCMSSVVSVYMGLLKQRFEKINVEILENIKTNIKCIEKNDIR